MIGKSIAVLIPPYRPQDFPEMFQMMQQGEAVDGYETVRMRKDGTLIEVSLTYSPVRSPSGRIIGASVVARDISKRKREDNERLGLIQELTAALSHPQHQPQPQARP
jgi:PAS domain S-box-containing protein